MNQGSKELHMSASSFEGHKVQKFAIFMKNGNFYEKMAIRDIVIIYTYYCSKLLLKTSSK